MAQSGEGTGRPLGFLDSFCIGVNAIVGTSIFLFPGLLAGLLGPVSPAAFIVTGVLLLPVALCYASAASRFDRAGGPYLYVRAAFGDRAGFGVGWMCWVTELFSWAAVASGLAAYLSYFGPGWGSPGATKALATALVAGMAALNYRGVKLGARVSDAFTVAKLVPLGLFVALGAFHLHRENFTPLAPHGWAPLGKACFLAFFSYSGFEVVPVPAGEVVSPQRNVPKALVASLLVAAVLYTLVQSVAVGVHAGLAGSQRPLADAAAMFLGPAGAALMVAGAAVSNVGFNAGCALGGPRYLVALAADAHLPPWFAASHARFATPHRAILATAGLTIAAIAAFDFAKLVDFAIVVICAQYLGTCAALPFLTEPKGWRRWPLPAAGIGTSLWIGSQAGLVQLGWAAAVLALGFALNRTWRGTSGGRAPRRGRAS